MGWRSFAPYIQVVEIYVELPRILGDMTALNRSQVEAIAGIS